jgi:hypothetical protein
MECENMSSGQKSCAEDDADEYLKEHVKRLEELGAEKIALIIEDLGNQFQCLERLELGSMTRTGWYRVDRIKELIFKLQ